MLDTLCISLWIDVTFWGVENSYIKIMIDEIILTEKRKCELEYS